jgi:hypothetical protein
MGTQGGLNGNRSMSARQGNQESAAKCKWLRGMFEIGRHVGPSANVPDLRPRWMLRFLQEQACHQAFSPDETSHHTIG